MTYNYIKTQISGHVFELTLARASKRNAFTPSMVNEIHHAFAQANDNDVVKLVLIRAEGPVFCAGMDLKTFENDTLDVQNPLIKNKNISLGEVFDKLYKPSIALVEGHVIAGGFLIILGCTYVYCTKETQFRLPELALGIFPFQVMASLLKVLPEKKLLQLCLETAYFDAIKAKELGIVDGFLEEMDIDNQIKLFESADVNALKAGIEALRSLPSMAQENRYQFLKEKLDHLKNR